MAESLGVRKPRPPSRAWLAVPLLIVALISLDIGVVASQTVRSP